MIDLDFLIEINEETIVAFKESIAKWNKAMDKDNLLRQLLKEAMGKLDVGDEDGRKQWNLYEEILKKTEDDLRSHFENKKIDEDNKMRREIELNERLAKRDMTGNGQRIFE